MDYECSETGGNLKVSRESQSFCYFLNRPLSYSTLAFITAALFIYSHHRHNTFSILHNVTTLRSLSKASLKMNQSKPKLHRQYLDETVQIL